MSNLVIKELGGKDLEALLDCNDIFAISFEQMSDIKEEIYDLFRDYNMDIHDMDKISLSNNVWFKITGIIGDAWYDGNKKVSDVVKAIKLQLERLI